MPKKSGLTERIEIHVRFNEADPLGIVWYGHGRAAIVIAVRDRARDHQDPQHSIGRRFPSLLTANGIDAAASQ